MTQCLPRRSNDLAYGLEVLINHGRHPVQLKEVGLVDPHGVRVEKAFVVRVTGGTLIGPWPVWPPPSSATQQAGVHWDDRVPLSGALVRAAKKTTADNLVVHLSLSSATEVPKFRALRLLYSSEGREYVTRSTTDVVVRSRC